MIDEDDGEAHICCSNLEGRREGTPAGRTPLREKPLVVLGGSGQSLLRGRHRSSTTARQSRKRLGKTDWSTSGTRCTGRGGGESPHGWDSHGRPHGIRWMEVRGRSQQIRRDDRIRVGIERSETFARHGLHSGRRFTNVGEVREIIRGVPTGQPAVAEPRKRLID